MPDGLETEVKFQVDDLDAICQQLLAAGARQSQPRTLEHNLRWDGPADELTRSGRVLRLRQNSRARLTLKLPAGPWGTQVKTLRELELEISDFEVARQILHELGFRVWFVYEKYRQVFEFDGAEVCLDELPFGSFIEIEGTLDSIQTVVDRLGLDDSQRITAGYVSLFMAVREGLGLPFADCTFANWEGWQDGLNRPEGSE